MSHAQLEVSLPPISLPVKASSSRHLAAQPRKAPLDFIIESERRGNRRDGGAWEVYGAHRERVTRAILDLRRAGGRLGLLGAGNCNDVDLHRLVAAYREIHLVDIDSAALARAIQRQSPAVRSSLHAHAPVDLTGVLSSPALALDHPGGRRPGVARAVATIAGGLPGPFDVVASTCVMSQLGVALRRADPREHVATMGLHEAVGLIHLRTLEALTARDGAALLVNDVTSSNHLQLDEPPGEARLDDLVGPAAAAGLCSSTASPLLIRRLLRRDPVLVEAFAPPRALPAWVWTGQAERKYLVQALVLERRRA